MLHLRPSLGYLVPAPRRHYPMSTTTSTAPSREKASSSRDATSEESAAFAVRVNAIVESIKAGIKPGRDEAVQRELARLIGMLRRLYDDPSLSAIAGAEIAAKALLQDEPHIA